MKHREFKKKIIKSTAKILIFFLKVFAKTIPEGMLFGFSNILGKIYFLLSDKRRNRTIKQLTNLYREEKSSEEITRLAKRVFYEIAENIVETGIRLFKHVDLQKSLLQDISIEGADCLDEALKKKNGVICIGTHFGNFLFMALRLSLMGYPCTIVIKDTPNPVWAEIWHILMRNAGMQWIPALPRFKSVSDSLKWLKNGGVLFLYADQRKHEGVNVEFLNQHVGTVGGPAVMHLRTSAEILCALMIKLGRKKHKIIITSPITVKKSGDRKKDVQLITQAYTKIIEPYVKQYPEQWWWPWRKRMKGIKEN